MGDLLRRLTTKGDDGAGREGIGKTISIRKKEWWNIAKEGDH